MSRIVSAALAAFLFFCASAPAHVQADFIPLGPYSRIPHGWLEFCRGNPLECERGHGTGLVAFSAANLNKIRMVNGLVNSAIKPMSDQAQWGVEEKWSYPDTGYGDCEDYVLLKRKRLMEAGFPRAALLIAVVKQKDGSGHAVLVVRTTEGDLVLDSLEPEVKPWRKTTYSFYKVQSPHSPHAWHDIGVGGAVGSIR